MFNFSKQRFKNFIYQISIFILIFIITFNSINLFKLKNDFEQTNNIKNKQVSSLINEIGELKNQNQILQSQFLTQIDLINQDIANIISTKNSKNLTIQKISPSINSNFHTTKTLKASAQPKILTNQTIFIIYGTQENLTDTIILAIFNHNSNQATLISIPRDLYYNGRKINEFFHKFGPTETNRIISEITGVPIENYLETNLEAISKTVNLLDNIEINLEKPLIDNYYPDKNNSYISINFPKGKNILTGEDTLKIIRSRKSSSDFERSKRQHLVLIAIKNKLTEKTRENPLILFKLLKEVKPNLNTNLSINQIINYFNTFKSYNINHGLIIDTSNFLTSTITPTGTYILIPKTGDYLSLQNKLNEILNKN